MATGWGSSWDASGSAAPVAPRVAVPSFRYATGGARFGGLLLDGLLQSFLFGVIGAVGNFGGIALAGAVQDCSNVPTYGGTVTRCTGSPGAFLAVVGAAGLVSLVVWWKLVPARMADRGATVGMAAMGIRIVTADGHRAVGRGQAFLRAVAASLLPTAIWIGAWTVVLAAGAVSVRGADDADRVADAFRANWVWAAAMVLATLAGYLPMLWHFVDRRYQTLYDKLCGTVVIAGR